MPPVACYGVTCTFTSRFFPWRGEVDHLGPRLRMSGVIPLFPVYAFTACRGTALPSYLFNPCSGDKQKCIYSCVLSNLLPIINKKKYGDSTIYCTILQY
jgi:hypothetical protein